MSGQKIIKGLIDAIGEKNAEVIDQVSLDAIHFGTGWIRMDIDGTISRVSPERIMIKPDEDAE